VLQLGPVKQKRCHGRLAQFVGRRRGQHVGESRKCIAAIDLSSTVSQYDLQLDIEIRNFINGSISFSHLKPY